ncbi:hypothetical protein OG539_33660 [Actinacidiphila glaucinigra]|uniref:hypothetical protein n=1 Tax=Actinacidiphila glaucinigra TaxID=235986 RepID=UPI0032528E4D
MTADEEKSAHPPEAQVAIHMSAVGFAPLLTLLLALPLLQGPRRAAVHPRLNAGIHSVFGADDLIAHIHCALIEAGEEGTAYPTSRCRREIVHQDVEYCLLLHADPEFGQRFGE